MCIFAYIGFLRSSEVFNLRRSDAFISPTNLNFFLNIYSDGSWLLMSNLQSPLCPVRNLKIYLIFSAVSEDLNNNIDISISGFFTPMLHCSKSGAPSQNR